MSDQRDNIIEFAEDVLDVDMSWAHKLIIQRLAINPAVQVDGIDRRTAMEMNCRMKKLIFRHGRRLDDT